jgi:hypothetical protein
METVQTWTPEIHQRYENESPYVEMVTDISGEWVRYKDYKELSDYADKLAEDLRISSAMGELQKITIVALQSALQA